MRWGGGVSTKHLGCFCEGLDIYLPREQTVDAMGLGREVPVSLQRRRGTFVKQGRLSARPSKLNNDLSGEGHSVTHVSRHHLVYRQGMAIRVSGVEGGEVCGLGWGVHQVGVGVFHNNDHNDHTPCAA